MLIRKYEKTKENVEIDVHLYQRMLQSDDAYYEAFLYGIHMFCRMIWPASNIFPCKVYRLSMIWEYINIFICPQR